MTSPPKRTCTRCTGLRSADTCPLLPLFPVDILGRTGYTPLIASAQAQNNALVPEHLLLYGANVHHVDNEGFSALHYACGRPIRTLATANATARLLIARLLIAHGANVDVTTPCNRFTPFTLAMNANNLDVGRLLLDAGSDPNWVDNVGCPLIHYTVEYGYCDWLQMVLDYGADIESRKRDGINILWNAAKCGELGIVKMLLEKGAYLRDEGNTLLHQAVFHRRKEIVTYLMQLEDVDVGGKNYFDETPLHIAAMLGWYEGMSMLIENGCPLDEVGPEGHTVLHTAAAFGHDQVVSFLLDKGANTEILDEDGNTALMLAMLGGKLGARDLLIDAGAKPTTEGSGV